MRLRSYLNQGNMTWQEWLWKLGLRTGNMGHCVHGKIDVKPGMDMRSKKWMIGIAMAAGISAAAAGCGREAAVEESARPSVSRTEEPSSEEQTQKPTSPQPSEIEPFPGAEKETKAEPLKGGKRIVVMTDIHYLAQSLTDQGDMFRSMVEHGDGKLTNYVWEITDAAFEEIQLLNPDVLIISGI